MTEELTALTDKQMIERLEQRLQVLELALKPFADFWYRKFQTIPVAEWSVQNNVPVAYSGVWEGPTHGDCMAAAEVLEPCAPTQHLLDALRAFRNRPGPHVELKPMEEAPA